MTKVLTHTPPWLSRPSKGFQVFQSVGKQKASSTLSNGHGKKIDHHGPLRTLTHRGTEVLFVVDNEIRWSDLVLLKDTGGDPSDTDEPTHEDIEKHSRLLKASVSGQIRQLVISPLGDYLAIATSHTVHVAVLPARFDTTSSTPIRLKTFQLGPTAHVLEQAPLASVLWHPLGALGTCLVTVTTDACVRLWELNKDSRRSFDEPALALDLKKLANAGSYNEDMRASVYGTSKGFSPDQVEMEVAAACFGGTGTPDELGWAPMTLWFAMTEGDVYALCPLLPSKWQPSLSTIPSLSTSVVSKAAILDRDPDVPESEKRQAVQQQKWLADLDAQEPALELLPGGLDTVEIYQRPAHPPAIPKLQGPFGLGPEPDLDDFSDIAVIAPRLDDEATADYEEDEYGEAPSKKGFSIGLVCLLTRSATVHVCLDIAGIEATWLPSRRSGFQPPAMDDVSDLLVLESVKLGGAGPTSWPVFTLNIPDRYLAADPMQDEEQNGSYKLYVTQPSGVHSLDLASWTRNLEEELSGPSDAGSVFRIGVLFEAEKTIVDQLIKIASPSGPATAAISILDSDLSHFVFTISSNQPYSVTLDLPIATDDLNGFAPDEPLLLTAPEIRESYQPPRDFYTKTNLSCFVDTMLHSGKTRLSRADLTANVRLSPATLQLLTESHRVLSDETNKLGLAAADLFRRCQRMQAELAEQVRKVREINDRAADVLGHDDAGSAREKVASRMHGIREREEALRGRAERVRRKMAGLSGREASKREEGWAGETRELERALDEGIGKRVDTLRRLKEQLVARAGEVGSRQGGAEEADRYGGLVPGEVRKKKLDQVMALLERETALVDAVSDRLARLSGLS